MNKKEVLRLLDVTNVQLQAREAIEELTRLMTDKVGLDRQITELQRQLVLHESQLFLDGVEGKTEAARKAALEVKKAQDAEYTRLRSTLLDLQTRRDNLAVDIARQEKLFALCRARMRQNAAVLNFLGGDEDGKEVA